MSYIVNEQKPSIEWGGIAHEQIVTPAEAAKDEDCVAMEFPCLVALTLESGVKVLYEAGVHPVPKKYADHWFLAAQNVKVVPEKAQRTR